MAKRRRQKKKKDNTVKTASDFSSALRDASIKQFGQDDNPSVDDFFDVEGVSIADNVALQYVVGTDVIPFSRLYTIIGPAGGGKTQFAIWIAGQFIRQGGILVYMDSEKRPSPTLIPSILQLPEQKLQEQFIPCHISSIEDMNAKLAWYGSFYEKTFPQGGPPLFILVDSISQLIKEGDQNKYTDGDVSTNNIEGMQNAAEITRGLKRQHLYLTRSSMVLTLIAHQKTEANEGGGRGSFRSGPKKNTGSGGTHKDFAASLRLVLTKGGKKDTLTSGRVQEHYLQADKSSLGEDKRKLRYKVVTYMNPDDGQRRTDFLWDEALIDLLMDEKKTSKEFLKAEVGLTRADKGFNVKALQLKGATKEEAGRAINANNELVITLQKYFRISGVKSQQKTKKEGGVSSDVFE